MIYFKKAEIEDVPVIYHLMIQAFLEYRTDSIPSSALEEKETNIFNAFVNDYEEAFIAYDFDDPIGMVRFRVQNNILTFYRLSVIPEYQGKGIGKKLLNFLENHAQNMGVDAILCKVRLNVTRNIKMYSSLGYVIFDEYIIEKPRNQNLKIVSMKKEIKN